MASLTSNSWPRRTVSFGETAKVLRAMSFIGAPIVALGERRSR
jgi:hypothetical protein